MTRVLITGSRDWRCDGLALAIVRRLVALYGESLVCVHGDAPGVDFAFRDACLFLGVQEEPHPANWGGIGRAAGPVRNREMVDAGAELCIAVHRDIRNSKGTRNCVTLALRKAIPVYLIDSGDVDEHGRHRLRRIGPGDY